jgi:hypothetical protein
MPVNTQKLARHVKAVNAGFSNNDTLISQIKATHQLVKQIAIPFESNYSQVTAESTTDLEDLDRQKGPQPRWARHRLLESLEKQLVAAEALPAGDIPRLSAVEALINRHRTSAMAIVSLAKFDIDPLHVEAFIETAAGQKALKESAATARGLSGSDEKAFRARVAKGMANALASNLSEYLDTQYPETVQRASAPYPSERDLLKLSKDIMYASKNQGRPIMDGILETLEAGVEDGRWNLDPHFLTKGYWQSAAEMGFDSQLGAYSDLTDTVRLADQISPIAAVRMLTDQLLQDPIQNGLATAKAKNPTVVFFETGDGAIEDQLKSLKSATQNKVAVVGDDQGKPIVVTPISVELPGTWLITAAGKRLQTLNTAHVADTDSLLQVVRDIASESPELPQRPDITGDVAELYDRWRALPINNKDTLNAGLKSIQEAIRALTATQPAPGFGEREQGKPVRDLVALSLLANSGGYDRAPLPFGIPRGLGTVPPGQAPDAELVINQDDESYFTGRLFQLDEHGTPLPSVYKSTFSTDRKTLNKQISALIAQDDETIGIKQSNQSSSQLPGLRVIRPLNTGAAVHLGHWMSQKDTDRLTQHTPLELIRKDALGHPFFKPEDSYARPEREAASRCYEIVELIHGNSISEETAMWAMEFAEFDGDYLLDTSGDDLVGATKFRLEPELRLLASDEDMKTAIVQQIARSITPAMDAAVMINRVKSTSWAQAKMHCEHLTPHTETSSGPSM